MTKNIVGVDRRNGELVRQQAALNESIRKTQIELDQSNTAGAQAKQDAAWQMDVSRVARELSRSPTAALEQIRPLVRNHPDDPKILWMLLTLATGEGAFYAMEARLGNTVDAVAVSPSGRQVVATGYSSGNAVVLNIADGTSRTLGLRDNTTDRSTTNHARPSTEGASSSGGFSGQVTFLDENRVWFSRPSAMLFDSASGSVQSYTDRLGETWAAAGRDLVLGRAAKDKPLVCSTPLIRASCRSPKFLPAARFGTLAWSPDGRDVAIWRDSAVEVISADAPQSPPIVRQGGNKCAFSADSRLLVCLDRNGAAILDRTSRANGFQAPRTFSNLDNPNFITFGTANPYVVSIIFDNVTRFYEILPFSGGAANVEELKTFDTAMAKIAAAVPFDVTPRSDRVDIYNRRARYNIQITDLLRYANHTLILPGEAGLVVCDESGSVRVYSLTDPGGIRWEGDGSLLWAGSALWKFLPDHAERAGAPPIALDTGFKKLVGTSSAGHIVYTDSHNELRWIDAWKGALAKSRNIVAGEYEFLGPHSLLADRKGNPTLIDFASDMVRPVKVSPKLMVNLSPDGSSLLGVRLDGKIEHDKAIIFRVDAYYAEWWTLDGLLLNQFVTKKGKISHVAAEKPGTLLVGVAQIEDNRFGPPRYTRLAKDGGQSDVSLEALTGVPSALVQFPVTSHSISGLADLLYLPLVSMFDESYLRPGQHLLWSSPTGATAAPPSGTRGKAGPCPFRCRRARSEIFKWMNLAALPSFRSPAGESVPLI